MAQSWSVTRCGIKESRNNVGAGLRCRTSALGSRGGLRYQLVHPVRHLSALGDPVFNAITLQFDAGGVGTGVVGPPHLHRTAVARPFLLDYHHSLMRLLASTHSPHTN